MDADSTLVVRRVSLPPTPPSATPVSRPRESAGDVTRRTTRPVAKTLPIVFNVKAERDSMRADFGSGRYAGGPIGIPYVTVRAGQKRVPVSFDYADESDRGRYPIPPRAPIEGGRGADGDRATDSRTSRCPGDTSRAGTGRLMLRIIPSNHQLIAGHTTSCERSAGAFRKAFAGLQIG